MLKAKLRTCYFSIKSYKILNAIKKYFLVEKIKQFFKSYFNIFFYVCRTIFGDHKLVHVDNISSLRNNACVFFINYTKQHWS